MSADVIVIGAGITGISAALLLQAEGAKITIIDPLIPGDEGQASFGNAGVIAIGSILPLASRHAFSDMLKMLVSRDAPMFAPAGHLPKLARFGLSFLSAGRHKYDATVEALSGISMTAVDDHMALNVEEAKALIRHGPYASVFRSAKEFKNERHHFEEKRSLGFQIKYIKNEKLDDIDPNLSSDFRYAAMVENCAWIESPMQYMQALYQRFKYNGGKHVVEPVTKLDNNSVTTQNASHHADKIIVAAGAYSARILKSIGMNIPMEAERGYHLFMPNCSLRPNHPFMHGTASIVATPMKGGLRVAGIAEYGGLDRAPRKQPIAFLKRHLREIYPDIDLTNATEWMGRRPTLPDSMPMIGAIASHRNIICAFGAQHIGLTLGPRIGILAKDLALGRKLNYDLTAFNPHRFD